MARDWSSIRRCVHIPIGLYAITSSMFMPIFQSLVYRKACLDLRNSTGLIDCDNEASRALARDPTVQTEANYIMMWCSTAMCLGAMVSSMILGRLGDAVSHRLSLLIPLLGLVASDVILLIQWTAFQSSTTLLILAEAVFGIAGGYVSIFSAAFAYISLAHEGDADGRAASIARLEGVIGGGSVIGLLITSQLAALSYRTMFSFCLVVHCLCVLIVIWMLDPMPRMDAERREKEKEDRWAVTVGLLRHKSRRSFLSRPLLILLAAFTCCFFAFIGTAHLLFFYLKHRFTMSIYTYSLYRAGEKALSTVTALFLFPLLHARFGFRISSLALIGMLTRAASKAWHAAAWTEGIVFGSLIFEAFSRFAASGLRSLMAGTVRPNEQGRLFSLVGALEAVCNLAAVLFFHSIFPWSLDFMSQLSFVLMAAVIIPPAVALWWYRDEVDSPKPMIEEIEEKVHETGV